MNAPEYIRAIWQGDAEEAVRQIYRTNPFAHTCGRVCTHRCETACSIGKRGEPVAIRWLKRWAMDAVGDERVREIVAGGPKPAPTGYSIGIVGSGPAGLTAAFDLAKIGHKVVVYEALQHPGGMPRYGIPSYRLPYDRLDADIEVIEAAGVEIRCGVRVGSDVSMDQLREDHDAVLLALGLQLGRSTRIPGSEHHRVLKAVDLLREITDEHRFEVPRQAVVIGGGNVAMDIARSLARLQRQTYGEIRITLTALEDSEHFLADPDEVREADEEAIEVLDARGPQECLVENGELKGLRTWKVLSIFDDHGRFAPRFDESDEQVHPGDMVIEAIGQMSDTALLGQELTERLEWNRGRLQVNEHCRTSEEWLWAAGDMVNGPDVVHAVADGHKVAADIDGYLTSTLKQETAA
jgi:glutamate synthase (NADPH/NADH) small chain